MTNANSTGREYGVTPAPRVLLTTIRAEDGRLLATISVTRMRDELPTPAPRKHPGQLPKKQRSPIARSSINAVSHAHEDATPDRREADTRSQRPATRGAAVGFSGRDTRSDR
jgi:hypothetical protein